MTTQLPLGPWAPINPSDGCYDLKEERPDGTVVYRKLGDTMDTVDDAAKFLALVLGPVVRPATWGKR